MTDFCKISVRDITEQCGLNRQTFYYHFQDNMVTDFIGSFVY
ncbi:MAG: TetR family transcriptional regulator [Holdemania massiliensis]